MHWKITKTVRKTNKPIDIVGKCRYNGSNLLEIRTEASNAAFPFGKQQHDVVSNADLPGKS